MIENVGEGKRSLACFQGPIITGTVPFRLYDAEGIRVSFF
jgi:hypothetical protein